MLEDYATRTSVEYATSASVEYAMEGHVGECAQRVAVTDAARGLRHERQVVHCVVQLVVTRTVAAGARGFDGIHSRSGSYSAPLTLTDS